MQESSSQKRALRIVLAALLESNLSVEELRQFANSLLKGDVGYALANSIEVLVAQFPSEKGVRKEPKNSDTVIDSTLETIRRRKLSKDAILNLIRVYGGSKAGIGSEDTIRSIVTEFQRFASPVQFQEFLTKIQGGPTGDPFLKGIATR